MYIWLLIIIVLFTAIEGLLLFKNALLSLLWIIPLMVLGLIVDYSLFFWALILLLFNLAFQLFSYLRREDLLEGRTLERYLQKAEQAELENRVGLPRNQELIIRVNGVPINSELPPLPKQYKDKAKRKRSFLKRKKKTSTPKATDKGKPKGRKQKRVKE